MDTYVNSFPMGACVTLKLRESQRLYEVVAFVTYQCASDVRVHTFTYVTRARTCGRAPSPLWAGGPYCAERYTKEVARRHWLRAHHHHECSQLLLSTAWTTVSFNYSLLPFFDSHPVNQCRNLKRTRNVSARQTRPQKEASTNAFCVDRTAVSLTTWLTKSKG